MKPGRAEQSQVRVPPSADLPLLLQHAFRVPVVRQAGRERGERESGEREAIERERREERETTGYEPVRDKRLRALRPLLSEHGFRAPVVRCPG